MEAKTPRISTMMWVNEMRINVFPRLQKRVDDLYRALKVQATTDEVVNDRLAALSKTQDHTDRQITTILEHRGTADDEVRRVQDSLTEFQARLERTIANQAQAFDTRITKLQSELTKTQDEFRDLFQQEQKMRMALQANVEAQTIDSEEQRRLMAEQLESIISNFSQVEELYKSTIANSEAKNTKLQEGLDHTRKEQTDQAQKYAALAARLDTLQELVIQAAQRQNIATLPTERRRQTTPTDTQAQTPRGTGMPPPARTPGQTFPMPQPPETALAPLQLSNSRSMELNMASKHSDHVPTQDPPPSLTLPKAKVATTARQAIDVPRSSSKMLPAPTNNDEDLESLVQRVHDPVFGAVRSRASLNVPSTRYQQDRDLQGHLSCVDELALHTSQRIGEGQVNPTGEARIRSELTLANPAGSVLGSHLSTDILAREQWESSVAPIASYRERPSALLRPEEPSPSELSSVRDFGSRQGVGQPPTPSFVPSELIDASPARLLPDLSRRKRTAKAPTAPGSSKQTARKSVHQPSLVSIPRAQREATSKPATKSRMLRELQDTWNTGIPIEEQAQQRPKRNIANPANPKLKPKAKATKQPAPEGERDSEAEDEQPAARYNPSQYRRSQIDSPRDSAIGIKSAMGAIVAQTQDIIAQHQARTTAPSPQPAEYDSFEVTLPTSRTVSRMRNRKRRSDVDHLPEGESERGTQIVKRRLLL